MKSDLENALEVKILHQSPKLQRFIKLLTPNKEMKFVWYWSLDRKTTVGCPKCRTGIENSYFPKLCFSFWYD